MKWVRFRIDASHINNIRMTAVVVASSESFVSDETVAIKTVAIKIGDHLRGYVEYTKCA